MKLEEGSRYLFDVEKIVALNADDFFVLKGPDKQKYLLKCSEYKDYNIECGIEIDCRLDKINCKGEFFLEPLHPYYSEGENYMFYLKKYEHRVDKDGRSIRVAVLNNSRKDEIVVEEDYFSGKMPEPGTEVSIRINKIIKGLLIAGETGDNVKFSKDYEKDIRSFLLLNESPGLDNKMYYVISDSEGSRYTLRKDYYSHYGLKLGETFKARFIRYKDSTEINVEPLNPWFEPGSSYGFIVKSIVELSGEGDYIVLADERGREHSVAYRKDLKPGDSVEYKVQKMRKGWPLLIQL